MTRTHSSTVCTRVLLATILLTALLLLAPHSLADQIGPPPPPPNQPPSIDSIMLSTISGPPGTIVLFQAAVHDADGDLLTYLWSFDGVPFSNALSAFFTIPLDPPNLYPVTFQVTDSQLASDSLTFEFTVLAGDGLPPGEGPPPPPCLDCVPPADICILCGPNAPPNAVPEPSSVLLVGTGLLSAARGLRKFLKK